MRMHLFLAGYTIGLMMTGAVMAQTTQAKQTGAPAAGQAQPARQLELQQLFARLVKNQRFGDSTYQRNSIATANALEPATTVSGRMEGYMDGNIPKVGFRGLVFTTVLDRKGGSHTFYLMNGDVGKATSNNLVITDNLAGIEMTSAGNWNPNANFKLTSNEDTTIRQLVVRANHLEGAMNAFEGSNYQGLTAGFWALATSSESSAVIPVAAAVLNANLQSSPNEGPVKRVPVRLTALLCTKPDSSEPQWVIHVWADSKEFTFPTTFICR